MFASLINKWHNLLIYLLFYGMPVICWVLGKKRNNPEDCDVRKTQERIFQEEEIGNWCQMLLKFQYFKGRLGGSVS